MRTKNPELIPCLFSSLWWVLMFIICTSQGFVFLSKKGGSLSCLLYHRLGVFPHQKYFSLWACFSCLTGRSLCATWCFSLTTKPSHHCQQIESSSFFSMACCRLNCSSVPCMSLSWLFSCQAMLRCCMNIWLQIFKYVVLRKKQFSVGWCFSGNTVQLYVHVLSLWLSRY